MIPIPPQVFLFAIKYGQKILVGFLAVALVAGAYFFWEHKQEKEGRDKERLQWEERDRATVAKSVKLLQQANEENARLRELDQQRNLEAIKNYAQYNQKLERDLADNINKRLRIRATCPSGSINAAPVKTDLPERANPRNERTDWAELAESDSRAVWRTAYEVDRMSFLCKQAIHSIEQNYTLK